MRLRPIRRAARKTVAAVAHRLPEARGRALLAGARAAFTLITGRPTSAAGGRRKPKAGRRDPDRGRKAPEAKVPAAAGASSAPAAAKGGPPPLTEATREEIKRAELELELGEFGKAARRSRVLVRDLPANLRVLQLHVGALAGIGDANELAVALHRLHVFRDDPEVRRRERAAAGLLLASTPGWLPGVPGVPTVLQPADDAVALFLADASAPSDASLASDASHPSVATPSTERLRQRLTQAAGAGYRPEVLTALGFPRNAGVTEVPEMEVVDGVPHHRMDLGPFYALDVPADRWLRDAAWLAAGVTRRIRPSLLHVIVDESTPEMALVGAAVRLHLGLPLVLEVVSGSRAAATADAARAQATVTRALEAADRAIVADRKTRDHFIGQGLDADDVTIVATDLAKGGGEALRSAYAAAMGRRGTEARA